MPTKPSRPAAGGRDRHALGEDAVKLPLYVYRPLLNADAVRAWARAQGLKIALAPNDMHTTVVFSREPVAWWVESDTQPVEVTADGGDRSVEKFGDALVLTFQSPVLFSRWRQYRKAGASWDFEDYRPHVTVTYKHAGSTAGIKPYAGSLRFGPERYEEIKDDNGEDVSETSLAKLSHREAAYAATGTPTRHCALCSMYRPAKSERCTLVENPIDWFGYCKHFDRKETS